MRDTHSSQTRDAVYVVFRVFSLEDDSIGLRVYVDPEQHRLDGELVFAADSVTVTLGRRF